MNNPALPDSTRAGEHANAPVAAADTPSVGGADGVTFRDLKLPDSLLQALIDVGYEYPTPIQLQTIPPLLEGKDVLGHAPTGTGKTAAFALPLIAREMIGAAHGQAASVPTDAQDKPSTGKSAPRGRHTRGVRILVLTPTRELAIQVAEAFRRYAKQLPEFSVVPIYGGQDYNIQLRQLQRGVQVVVGTPGRVMDHMRRGTLKLDGLESLVLDEADEMLRMGFIDDIDWILEQAPKQRQMALFSATMPRVIRTIARKHQNEPVEIAIENATSTASTINQRFWLVSGLHKLDALTRILEHESFDAVLVFVRTRTATVELAERLQARGHRSAAINGDLPQKQREKMVDQFKRGSLDILVATDVAARGLDVERVSHVINFDIPYDTEAYVHRIGRTGRAGRHGEAILFVTPRERRMLHTIEKATRQRISQLELPTTNMVNDKRIADFKQRISDTLNAGENPLLRRLIEEYQQEHDVPATEVAAALATMMLGDKPLLLKDERLPKRSEKSERKAKPTDRTVRATPATDRSERKVKPTDTSSTGGSSKNGSEPATTGIGSQERGVRKRVEKDDTSAPPADEPRRATKEQTTDSADAALPMESFRVEVGASDELQAGNLVGAIANEAGIDAQFIGKIDIHDDHSTVELPTGMPKEIFQDLKKAWVCGKRLRITRMASTGTGTPGQSRNVGGNGTSAADTARVPGGGKAGKRKSKGKVTAKVRR